MAMANQMLFGGLGLGGFCRKFIEERVNVIKCLQFNKNTK